MTALTVQNSQSNEAAELVAYTVLLPVLGMSFPVSAESARAAAQQIAERFQGFHFLMPLPRQPGVCFRAMRREGVNIPGGFIKVELA